MRDPGEGVGPYGEIVTGVDRRRVPAVFEPVVAAAVAALTPGTALYLYGSVATGRARVGESDVDLLSVGLPGPDASALGAGLSRRFGKLCRGVEVAPMQLDDLRGEGDEAYGARVFLRHYCVQLAGPPRTDLGRTYPADVRAARGFNGDIARHAGRWQRLLDDGAEPVALGCRVARKSLLAAAGLVSVVDGGWTTDRAAAARRWAEIEPGLAAEAALLHVWTGPDPTPVPTGVEVRRVLDGAVARLVARFAETVGLWPD